jgi:hypothetical protein
MLTNWKKNERRAAAALGLSAEPEAEPVEVRTLDTDLDDEGRVTLTVTLAGSLSIQVFKDSGAGVYRLHGSVILPAEFTRDWVKTLYFATAKSNEERSHV